LRLTTVKTSALLALGLAGLGCASGSAGTSSSSGPRAMSGRDMRPLTRAERSKYTETSTHADVMGFIDSLKATTPNLHVTTLGRSTQGKDIPLVVLSRPAVRTAAEARRLNRPIVLLQGNIHGGEVEGKEVVLAVLRDLAKDPNQNVLDSLVIVAVPIYNTDGNDAMGPQERNRGAQNGPQLIGQRPNGQGLDLNRDYIKAEAPETRAALDLMRAWDPDVFVDLHTTNGSFHGYGLTYAPSLNPAAIFAGPFTRDTVLPTVRQVVRARHRVETFPYGNFASQDSVERGWFTYDHRPRFGTNYYGLRGRVSILSEAYSHDPFEKRIRSTYAFVAELLHIVAANSEDILEIRGIADSRTTALASVGPSTRTIPIRSRITRAGHIEDMLIEEVVRTGDSVRTEPGLRPGLRRTGKVRTVKVPVMDRADPVLEQTLPYAWVIPEAQSALLEHLRRHGIIVERMASPTVVRAEHFAIDSVVKAPQPFQGHQEVRLVGRWTTADTMTISTSAYVVRAGQPLGILALYLLEPQSDDGLTNWNFLDAWLQPGGRYPLPRVVERITSPLRPAQ
jgi:hypothetical protein